MSPYEREQYKAIITPAFEHMGPDRVARGMRAQVSNWESCFLAFAYSELRLFSCEDAACKTGLTLDQVGAVVSAFDRNYTFLKTLAAEWLEHNTNAHRIHCDTVGASNPAAPRAVEMVTD